MKKSIFLIALLVMVLAIIPQVQAQTQQQEEEIRRAMNDWSEGRITQAQYMRRVSEIMNPPETTPSSTQLVTPTGKAWIIQDNNIQGSGKAYIFNSDNTFELYFRSNGIWVPIIVKANSRYEIRGNNLNLNFTYLAGSPPLSEGDTYVINGNTLEFKGERWTLLDFPGVLPPGGSSIVNPPGTGWFGEEGYTVYNADGTYQIYSNSGQQRAWGTYRFNQSTGEFYENYQNQRESAVRYYTVRDFGSGNKTLRIWFTNQNGYFDENWKLQAIPRR